MYTSDEKVMSKNADVLLHDAKLCLLAALFCALFGGIYELFSHDVYSAYMIGAFTIPLLLGALPAGCISRYINAHIKKIKGGGQEEFFSERPDKTATVILSEAPEPAEERAEFPGEETVGAVGMELPNPPEPVEERAEFPGGEKARSAGATFPGLIENAKYDNHDTDRYDMIGEQDSLFREKEDNKLKGICIPGRVSRNAWYSGLAALTVGCIFRGVLDIYGTTNRLLVVYPLVAATLLGIGFIAFLIPRITLWRMTLRQRE